MAGIHDKHRERVRNEFLARGFNDNTPEHKVLEMLLFYCIPRKDTNELAHKLINHFGSLANLLEADPKEIMKIEGAGPATAALMKLILSVTNIYHVQKVKPIDKYENMDEICKFFMEKYVGQTREVFSIMSFDSSGRKTGFDFLGSGDVYSVGITSRMVMETVIKNNAACIIIAHNHPGGYAIPSDDDIEITKKIRDALVHINVKLIDHIIICDDDYVVLGQSQNYMHIFE